jgi:hypothetical protein
VLPGKDDLEYFNCTGLKQVSDATLYELRDKLKLHTLM